MTDLPARTNTSSRVGVGTAAVGQKAVPQCTCEHEGRRGTRKTKNESESGKCETKILGARTGQE